MGQPTSSREQCWSDFRINVLAYLFKARIVKLAERTVSMEWFCKHARC
jgi:hypothetical protein